MQQFSFDTFFKTPIVWRNVATLGTFHILALQGLYYVLILQVKWQSLLFAYFLLFFTNIATTAGAHRLWSHHSYKASLPLRLFLVYFQSTSYMLPIFQWARDHRVHHKYADTDADPHNSTRGFFFAHMGWTFLRKHPDVIAKGKGINVDDLYADRLVMFQYKYYLLVASFLAFVVPTVTPVWGWNEDWYVALTVCGMLRCMVVHHLTYCINSVAHMFGTRPYDGRICPTENAWVSYTNLGEGWHNYHHSFPWDYKAGELGNNLGNVSAVFIELMAKLGLASDLKMASSEMIKNKMVKFGMESVQ